MRNFQTFGNDASVIFLCHLKPYSCILFSRQGYQINQLVQVLVTWVRKAISSYIQTYVYIYINKREGTRQFLSSSQKKALSWWNFYLRKAPRSIASGWWGEEGRWGGLRFLRSAVFHRPPLLPPLPVSRLRAEPGAKKRADPMVGHLRVLE